MPPSQPSRRPIDQPPAWDAFVAAHPRAHFLQHSQWGLLKSAVGWRSVLSTVEDVAGRIVGGAVVLLRPLPARLGTMAYLPMGPLVKDEGMLPVVWASIHADARRAGAAFLKWEPGLDTDDMVGASSNQGLRPSAHTIQPPRTILVDLTGGDDAILARMSQNTRRKVRLAERRGVIVRQATPDDLPAFTALMAETGLRNAFGVHQADYYTTAYHLFVPTGLGALFVAEHEGAMLAAVFALALGRTAWYWVGASSRAETQAMASYGVQWAVMRWAAARGCTSYDLWGVPDDDEAILEAQFQARSDGLWGVYGFKRGFGGRVVRSAGAFDVAYNALVTSAYHAAMRLRRARQG